MDQNKINEYIASVSAEIKYSGFFVQFVLDEEKQIHYSYTLGLSQTTPYEIILGGFTKETGSAILSKTIGYIKDNDILLEQENDVIGISNVPMKLRKISNELGCVLCSIINVLHPDSNTIDFYQLVWPDEKGVFPPDEDCTKEFADIQNLDSFVLKSKPTLTVKED